jgi:hypothetical protein
MVSLLLQYTMGRHDHILVGFTTTCAIGAYRH